MGHAPAHNCSFKRTSYKYQAQCVPHRPSLPQSEGTGEDHGGEPCQKLTSRQLVNDSSYIPAVTIYMTIVQCYILCEGVPSSKTLSSSGFDKDIHWKLPVFLGRATI